MATINSGSTASVVRVCGLKISTGGADMPHPISATVKHNRWYQANSFEAKIALYGSPYDIAWWGDNARLDDFPMEITFIVDGNTQKMMAGQVDKASLDTKKGVVTVHGRDNAALLIDTMTKESFTDQKVVDIVKALAGRVGLNAEIDDGDEWVANLVRDDKHIFNIGATFGHAVSYWDMLSWMAREFNYYIYVSGDTLFFHHQDHDGDTWQVILDPPDDNGDVIILKPSTVSELILERDYNLARNTSVLVYSRDADNKVTYKAISPQDGGLRGGQRSQTLQYMKPGIASQADAQSLADSMYDSSIRHEKKVHWTEPGDLYLSCLEQVEITKGSTAWHQKYFLESIDRTMDWKGGFTMQCVGTNNDPALSNGGSP